MMRHPVLAILLALVLALGTILSGPATAQARGITVELCSDAGTVTVTLGPTGRPVIPHRRCPLCLAAQATALPPAPAGWSRPTQAARAVPQSRPVPLEHDVRHSTPFARAPPLPV